MLQVNAAWDDLPRLHMKRSTGPVQSQLNSFDVFPWIAAANELPHGLHDSRSTLFRKQEKDSENDRVTGVARDLCAQERKNPLPSPCVVILRETGMNPREVEFDLSTALDSGNANVLSLPAFRSLHDIELHGLAFLK